MKHFGYSVIDISNFFLAVAEKISHLKLQKLVYYAQGSSLALCDTVLFDESIEAWLHGPVCPVLYNKFKGQKELSNLVEERDKALNIEYDLMKVWDAFGGYDGWKLENMTKQEDPWLKAIKHGVGTEIDIQVMYDYFKQFV